MKLTKAYSASNDLNEIIKSYRHVRVRRTPDHEFEQTWICNGWSFVDIAIDKCWSTHVMSEAKWQMVQTSFSVVMFVLSKIYSYLGMRHGRDRYQTSDNQLDFLPGSSKVFLHRSSHGRPYFVGHIWCSHITSRLPMDQWKRIIDCCFESRSTFSYSSLFFNLKNFWRKFQSKSISSRELRNP